MELDLQDLFKCKVCLSCKIKKHVDEFGRNKSQPDGKNCYCKQCIREKSKKNDSKYKAYQKLWRQKNSESVKAYQKQYKLDNRERINAYQRARPLDKKRATNTSEKKKLKEKERRQTQI